MLILKPDVHETIWGGDKLTPYSNSNCKKIGHLYSAYQVNGNSNLILNGSWKGKTFGEYFLTNRERFRLSKYKEFPLVIALVDAADNLSIQVHPDDEMALKLENLPFGKNESWYFINAPKMGSIYNGCLCDSIDDLKKAIEKKEIDKTVDLLPIKEGDYVYIVGGTLHALSTGSLVYEIEENSEVTYRFYDFDRLDKDGKLRPLQIEQALASVHVKNKSKVSHYGSNPIEERMYQTQKIDHFSRYINESDTLECLTILKGEVYISSEEMTVRTGQTIILEPQDILEAYVESAIIARPKY